MSKKTELDAEQYKQMKLFVCEPDYAAIKEVIPGLEHPFFTISTRPDTKTREYEHNGKWLLIEPHTLGLPTQNDKDILVYLISRQIAQSRANGEVFSRRVRFNVRHLLLTTGRKTGKKDYEGVLKSLKRLKGCVISTNIAQLLSDIALESEATEGGFGFLDYFHVKRQGNHPDGRMEWVEVVLSEWIYDMIERRHVLTLHDDYFALPPLKKRIYEIGRKHIGAKQSFTIGIDLLHKKTGARDVLRNFRACVKKVALENTLPEFNVQFEKDTDQIVFIKRVGVKLADTVPEEDEQTYSMNNSIEGEFIKKHTDASWREGL